MRIFEKKSFKQLFKPGKIAAILLLLLITCCFSGCAKPVLTLQTELIFSEEGSGSRVMRMNMSRKDFKKAFKDVNADSLSEQISKACPKALEYVFTDDGKQYTWSFALTFKSIKDYEKKTSQVIGEEADIIYEKPESVFASGFHYSENFTTRDLIGWIDGPAASMTEGSTVFTKYLTKDGWSLNYADQLQFARDGGVVEVNTLVETPVERIDILSLYHQNQSISRSVILVFSKDSMEKNGTQVKKHLESLVPEDAVMTWSQSADKSTCEIRQNYMTAAQTSEFMKKLTDSEKTGIRDRNYDNKQIFSYSVQRKETLDFASFLYETSPTMQIGYYVQWENGMNVSIIKHGDTKDLRLEKSDVYGAYYKVIETNAATLVLTTSMSAAYGIDEIDVDTDFKDDNRVTRTTSVVFHSAPSEEEAERMRKSIAAKADSYAEVVLDVERSDKKHAIKIIQTGNREFINEGFRAIFGTRGQLAHQSNGTLLAFQHEAKFSDIVDFSKFITNESKTPLLVYTLKLHSGESILKNSISSTISLNNGPEDVKSNRYNGSVDGLFMSLTMDTKVWNSDGIMLFVLIFGFLVILLAAAFAAKYLNQSIVSRSEDEEDDSTMGDRMKNRLSGIRVKASDNLSRTADRHTRTSITTGKNGRKNKTRSSFFVTEETTSFGDYDDADLRSPEEEDYEEESFSREPDPGDYAEPERKVSPEKTVSPDPYEDTDDDYARVPESIYEDTYEEDIPEYESIEEEDYEELLAEKHPSDRPKFQKTRVEDLYEEDAPEETFSEEIPEEELDIAEEVETLDGNTFDFFM